MDALILSCSTGGGHNAAGLAIKEELLVRGHRVEMMDPYALISRKLAYEIGNVYVKLVQRAPRVFGFTYALAGLVRRIPGQSPVYYANIQVAKKLEEYLEQHHFDVVIMPHLFPAELITYMKKRGVTVPISVFIATDYACIPFTEETNCDYYVIPGQRQMQDFLSRKIPLNKLKPFGIPVRRAFDQRITKKDARAELGLDLNRKYFLLTGGSIGAGAIRRAVGVLVRCIRKNNINGRIIVVCGNNKKLYKKLDSRYRDGIILLERTNRMALYMKACDVFISKPGGLSSTEAAVTGVPYIHITPIPGCETWNMRYFSKNGMSIGVKYLRLQLCRAVCGLQDNAACRKMKEQQQRHIPIHAREDICDWLEGLCADKKTFAVKEEEK